MRAMVLVGADRPLELREVPIPQVGPNDVLVRVRACGIGLTVVKGIADARVKGYPRIPGHELAGEVVTVGSEVRSVSVGDRVTCHFYLTCGQCAMCRSGRESLCPKRRGNVGRAIDGGYAEYVALPERNVVPVPRGVSDLDAAIACDAIATPYHACREASLRPGDTVLVIGAGGGVGIHAVQMARLFGARVLAADIAEGKLDLARRMGADEVIDARAGDLAERARSMTDGRGVDAVIDMVGSGATLTASFASLGLGGRWVLIGSTPDDPGARIAIDPRELQARAIEIHSSRYVSAAEIIRVLELVRQKRIAPVVTRTFRLEEAERAHEMIRRNETAGRLALVMEA